LYFSLNNNSNIKFVIDGISDNNNNNNNQNNQNSKNNNTDLPFIKEYDIYIYDAYFTTKNNIDVNNFIIKEEINEFLFLLN
jgi:hypothetical protein